MLIKLFILGALMDDRPSIWRRHGKLHSSVARHYVCICRYVRLRSEAFDWWNFI